ncbi:MAG: hypothetical protein AAB877_03460 [Patescibacteria group bacterium]
MLYFRARFTYNRLNPFTDTGVESVIFTAKDDISALKKSYGKGTLIRKWWSQYAKKAFGKWKKEYEQEGTAPLLHRLVRMKKRGRGFLEDMEIYGPFNSALLRELL